MNDIVKNENGTALVTENDANADLYFKIHQKITAKNEEISKSYNQNILVSFNDVNELHHKAMQSIDSLNPNRSEIGVRITVFHLEGESEKFNSFKEFETHNKTSPCPTTLIILDYNFSVYDLRSEQFENYKISCQLKSRIAELAEIEKDAPSFFLREFISSLITTTAKITVEYSDYVKARTFIAMFDEWVRGCDETKEKSYVKFLKKISTSIPFFGRYVIISLLAWFTADAIDSSIITNDLSVKFIVFYASFFVVIGGVSDKLLNWIHRSLNSYLALSYIEINKGDTKLISKYKKRNKTSLITSGIGFIGTLLIGLFTSATYDVIKVLVL